MAVGVHGNQRISARGRQNLVLIVPLLILLILRLSSRVYGLSAAWYPVAECAGLLLLLSGLWIRICARQWKAERLHERLVTDGFYGYIRHPLYVGSFLVWTGICVVLGDPVILLAFLVVFGISHGLVIRREESQLMEIFGNEYQDYRRRVPAFLPRPQTGVGRVSPRRLGEALVRECDAVCIGLAFPLFISLVRQLATPHPTGEGAASQWVVSGLLAALAGLVCAWTRLKQEYRVLIREERLRRGHD